jgi:glucosamine-6-phosphate deaminase
VQLDDDCRRQQVGENWFPSLDETPTHAATLTVPAIMQSRQISCVVPDARKANAVRRVLYHGKLLQGYRW